MGEERLHTLLQDSELDGLEPRVLRFGSATILNFLTPFSTPSGLPECGISSISILVTDALLLDGVEVGEVAAGVELLPRASFSLVSLSCEGVLVGGVRTPALRRFLVLAGPELPVAALAPSAPNTLSLGVTT